MRKLSDTITCCDEQRRYIIGHHEAKASMHGVTEKHDVFYVSHTGHCEFCGQVWTAFFSHLTQQIEYRKGADEPVQDDEG